MLISHHGSGRIHVSGPWMPPLAFPGEGTAISATSYRGRNCRARGLWPRLGPGTHAGGGLGIALSMLEADGVAVGRHYPTIPTRSE